MLIGKKEFDVKNKTYVMGILNVTPDSFSDGGKFNSMDRALSHVEQMIQEGADIIDVGGESTRPGYTLISDDEEISRVVPVIERIKKNFDTVISIDTYKSRVAEESAAAGADLINDIWGCRYDDRMADVIAEHGLACCLMHNRNVQKQPYENLMEDVCRDLQQSINIALAAGVKPEKIITDPGIGFGKNLEENLYVMNHVEQLLDLGYPVLLGTSRKSMIGLTLNLPADQRTEGTLVTTVMGVMKGCGFVRVHDVLANKRAIDMTEAILGKGCNHGQNNN
ncbi:MAG: dihydropteroate synthase [Lachnospiraceae bacterium]|nr:dihydropteroate synthase [Lachnospiraceae bacterium]